MSHENSPVEDEERIEDGQGQQKFVEEALLHHGRDRHQRNEVAEEPEEADDADRDAGQPEPVILNESVGPGPVTAQLIDVEHRHRRRRCYGRRFRGRGRCRDGDDGGRRWSRPVASRGHEEVVRPKVSECGVEVVG